MSDGRRRTEAVAAGAAGVLPFPRTDGPRSKHGRFPATRSILVGLALVVTGCGAYLAARETSAFALRAIEVKGTRPDVGARVRASLEPLVGSSLVSFDRAEARRRVLALPEIAATSFDRDFPHTLRVSVRLERPVAVLRQGPLAWVVSAEARVLRSLPGRPYPPLPRVWVPPSVDLVVGSTLGGDAAVAVRTVASLAAEPFPARVRSVVADDGEVTVVLGSGTQIRLGDLVNLRLKLAVAARLVPLARGASYVDVTVPERAVAELNHQVAG